MAQVKKTAARAAKTAALKTSTAAVGDNSAGRVTAALQEEFRAYGRNASQGKLNALFAFMEKVKAGTLLADDSKLMAACYAQGSTGDVKAAAQGAMSAAFKKCADKHVLAIGIPAFKKAVGDALATGRYAKSKTSKDAFDSHYAVAKAIVDADGKVTKLDEKFIAKAVAKKGGNRSGGAATEADRARKAIQNAVKKLAPKAMDKAQQAVVAKFYSLMGIKLEAVK